MSMSGLIDERADVVTLYPVISQPYTNCVFRAGLCEGADVDTVYIEMERDGERDVLLLLRPDEMAALVYCMGGALYSKLIEQVPADEDSQ
jgi:hypothetical protein